LLIFSQHTYCPAAAATATAAVAVAAPWPEAAEGAESQRLKLGQNGSSFIVHCSAKGPFSVSFEMGLHHWEEKGSGKKG